ncbi:Calcineurin subunit B [Ananas comosus]|uniref:Calcineurin subunit B n=1 Tax=Ananas comosus TaxID=4615 RepID=A0A199V3W1_ANACO|nr:Calcineurin subunit B [Ananas comosus]
MGNTPRCSLSTTLRGPRALQPASQQEIVSLYHRFCQLDRSGSGFISADEFLSVPEFAVNPLAERLLRMLDGLNFKDSLHSYRHLALARVCSRRLNVYDLDCNGKVTFDDVLNVLRDLTGSFMSEQQRQEVLTRVLEEAGYTPDSSLTLPDFMKILGNSDLKMEVEVPID